MKSRNIGRWVVRSAVVLIGWTLQSSSAQERSNDPFTPSTALSDVGPADTNVPRTRSVTPPSTGPARRERRVEVNGSVFVDPVPSGWDLKSAIRQAAEELRDAEGDEAQAKAQTNLRDLLSKYFVDDMKRRQAELEEMASRLRKLEEQLARRRDRMQEIVDLQIKVLINEADGLGFFSSGQPSDSQPTPNAYYFYSPRPNSPPQKVVVPTPALPSEADPSSAGSPRPARVAPVAPPTERYEPPQPAATAPSPERETDDEPYAE